MGITGLLPFLEKAKRTTHIREFRGSTVAIDSYCWLHKGATCCAEQLARGEDTDMYVLYCMKYIKMLLSYDIKPIMVFDGNHLPAKALTETRRREIRRNARVRAAELLRLGKSEEARNYFRQSVDITPKMALALIRACRKMNVDCIVAPFEADSQLAFLNLKGMADIIITEDSDLILFGCKKVFYKMDINGNGQIVESDKIHLCMKLRPDVYTFDKFRHMCILSGCDYLDSLPGIGLKKALKFISLTAETNPLKFLDKIPSYLNLRHLVITNEYKEGFMVAEATFRHQTVFNPLIRKLIPLTDPVIHGTRPEYCKNVGEFIDNEVALQVAIGNLNPFSLERVDNWIPSTNNCNLISSIWSPSYVKKISRAEQKKSQPLSNCNDQLVVTQIKSQQLNIQQEINDDYDKDFEKELKMYAKPEQIEDDPDIMEVSNSSQKENNHEITDDPLSTQDSPPDVKKLDPKTEKSPVPSLTVSNPFIKKKLSKFGCTTVVDNKNIVKSRYFHSKSEEIVRDDCVDITEEETVGSDAVSVNFRKRSLNNDNDNVLIVGDELKQLTCDIKSRSPVLNKTKTVSSNQAKKAKLVRSNSLGIPRNPIKNQLSLQVMFQNMKKT